MNRDEQPAESPRTAELAAPGHSQAREVSLDVDLDGDTLVVDIRDDGAGAADPACGSGLTGLGDRVDAARGALTITSPTGEGTTVRAALPVG